jgi:type I restriction enzyme M protein
VAALKGDLVGVKQKLIDLESDVEALELQQQTEIEAISGAFAGTARELSAHLRPIKVEQKEAVKAFKVKQKEVAKRLKADIKRLEKAIPGAERDLLLLTSRGKLELMLRDDDLIGTLKERWIAAEVAKRLDYPIFMAVSERGGKNNSGDYEFMLDAEGYLIEDVSGQPKVDQDLVNYDLTAIDLVNAASIPDEHLCVAEAFVRFVQEQRLRFWSTI